MTKYTVIREFFKNMANEQGWDCNLELSYRSGFYKVQPITIFTGYKSFLFLLYIGANQEIVEMNSQIQDTHFYSIYRPRMKDCISYIKDIHHNNS